VATRGVPNTTRHFFIDAKGRFRLLAICSYEFRSNGLESKSTTTKTVLRGVLRKIFSDNLRIDPQKSLARGVLIQAFTMGGEVISPNWR
jgi:hypothetical protein